MKKFVLLLMIAIFIGILSGCRQSSQVVLVTGTNINEFSCIDGNKEI